MRLALFGPPGAGKGTQAKRLAHTLAVTHVSTGDLFRAARRDGTPLGKQADAYIAKGRLVPDEVTNGLVAETLTALGNADFVLDGFPRTVPQAEWLLGYLAEHEAHLDGVISLRVPESALVQRLSRRRTDAETGAIYHLDFNPPPDDVPEDRLVHRKDDHPDAIRTRLAVYLAETEPLEVFFRRNARLVEVDGTGSMNDVNERVDGAVGQLRHLDGI